MNYNETAPNMDGEYTFRPHPQDTREQRLRKFRSQIADYKGTTVFSLRPDFEENIYEIRKYMMPRFKLMKPDILTYKKMLWEYIKGLETQTASSEVKNFYFTEKELLSNIVEEGEYKGWKITKLLSKKVISHYALHSLDFFNKPRDEREYYMTSDPSEILDAYLEISTCYSPEGENSANIYKYLASIYVYMVVDDRTRTRSIVFLDVENKLAFLHRPYGQNDPMMTIATVYTLTQMGYLFVRKINQMFPEIQEELHYIDQETCFFSSYLERADLFADLDEFHGPLLRSAPKYIGEHTDAITGQPLQDQTVLFDFGFYNMGAITEHGTAVCQNCGELVDYDHYDEDERICLSCADSRCYCNHCGDMLHVEDAIWDDDKGGYYCEYCYSDANENDNDDD